MVSVAEELVVRSGDDEELKWTEEYDSGWR